MAIKFYPAKHCNWVVRVVQFFNKLHLSWYNRLHLYSPDLKTLKTIPKNSGLILVANHSDETDIRVCMELSHRSKRRFTYMINSEAFEECRGLAGWWLQRLGCFSIERGGNDTEAIRYAMNTVKKEPESLVIFPEGEIYYANDLVQPFKTGAVHIGLQTILETRQKNPDWNIYLLPIAIKYRYRKTIEPILNKIINRMEKKLLIREHYLTFQQRLIHIMAKLTNRNTSFKLSRTTSEEIENLKKQIENVRSSILPKLESKYSQTQYNSKMQFLTRAQKMIFFLRKNLKEKYFFTPETRKQFKEDLKNIKESVNMTGWQPSYIDLHPSEERLAETVMNLERKVFRKKRPRALGNRDVFVRVGDPISLSEYAEAYQNDPSFVSHQIAEELQDGVQELIKKITF